MTVAVVSAQQFWGDFLLVLGSAFVLFSLVKTGMTRWWITWMPALGAILLGVGAALSVGAELQAYADKNPYAEISAGVVILLVIIAVPLSFLRAKRTEASKAREEAEHNAEIRKIEPNGQAQGCPKDEVDEEAPDETAPESKVTHVDESEHETSRARLKA